MRSFSFVLVSFFAFFLIAPDLAAHCDTISGPVATAARAALDSGNLTPLLRWVRPSDEAELRAAFERARTVRDTNAAARALGEQYFSETAVRLHRASEEEPFIGLRPDSEAEPSILQADAALEKGSAGELAGGLSDAVRHELAARFTRVVEARKHADESVEAGRQYVAAYVAYIHFVEQVDSLLHAEAHH